MSATALLRLQRCRRPAELPDLAAALFDALRRDDRSELADRLPDALMQMLAARFGGDETGERHTEELRCALRRSPHCEEPRMLAETVTQWRREAFDEGRSQRMSEGERRCRDAWQRGGSASPRHCFSAHRFAAFGSFRWRACVAAHRYSAAWKKSTIRTAFGNHSSYSRRSQSALSPSATPFVDRSPHQAPASVWYALHMLQREQDYRQLAATLGATPSRVVLSSWPRWPTAGVRLMATTEFFLDGKSFTTTEHRLTVRELLEMAGRAPGARYVVVKGTAEYADPNEPVEIGFGDKIETELKPDRASILRYKVNGEDQTTDRRELTVEEMLSLAGAAAGIDVNDIGSYFIENLNGQKYDNLSARITITTGDEFLAIHTGATPVA